MRLQYQVYVAPTERSLQEKLEQKVASAWCGMEGVLDPRACSFEVSPFQRCAHAAVGLSMALHATA